MNRREEPATRVCGATDQATRIGGAVEVYVCWREPFHDGSHHGPLMGRAPGPDEAFMTFEREALPAPLDVDDIHAVLCGHDQDDEGNPCTYYEGGDFTCSCGYIEAAERVESWLSAQPSTE